MLSNGLLFALGAGVLLTAVRWRIRWSEHIVVDFHGGKSRVALIRGDKECEQFFARLLWNEGKTAATKVVGFDAEWRPGKENKVCVLQVATSTLEVGVVQLMKLSWPWPKSLVEFLNSANVIKVGVNITGDAKRISRDWNVYVGGCLELQDMLSVDETKMSLQRMCMVVLGVRMKKERRLTLSDWQASHLSREQIEYAALDAIVSRLIFVVMCRGRPFALADFRDDLHDHKVESNVHYKINFTRAVSIGGNASQAKKRRKETSFRSKQLYDNCLLLAPDNEPISMITEKKMKWYLERGLAIEHDSHETIKSDRDWSEFVVIRLNFEPEGRTLTEDSYYLAERANLCVGCGSEEQLSKHYIVPYEFRQYFPFRFKVKTSHDIVLLCEVCRDVCTKPYQHFRAELLFQVMGSETTTIYKGDRRRLQIRRLARALLDHSHQLPVDRRREIEDQVSSYLGIEHAPTEVDLQAILDAPYNPANMKDKKPAKLLINRVLQGRFEIPESVITLLPDVEIGKCAVSVDGCACVLCEDDPSGKDFEHYHVKRFVRLWRQFFVVIINPKYLPEGWSIKHKIQDYKPPKGMEAEKAWIERLDTTYNK